MLVEAKRKINILLAEYEHARRRVREESVALEEAKGQVAAVLEAQKLVQGVAEAVQNQAHQRIASVVSRCLEAVFGENAYEFKIKFTQKRGKTEAELIFVRDDIELDDPLNAAGGGHVDIAAFALRLACLVLSRPQRRRLLVLDEPFSKVKPPEVYGPKICALLDSLAREMGVQFIIIPSIERYYRVGKVIEI